MSESLCTDGCKNKVHFGLVGGTKLCSSHTSPAARLTKIKSKRSSIELPYALVGKVMCEVNPCVTFDLRAYPKAMLLGD